MRGRRECWQNIIAFSFSVVPYVSEMSKKNQEIVTRTFIIPSEGVVVEAINEAEALKVAQEEKSE